MEAFDEVLAERLARLEGGEGLEACLTGLDEAEAQLVRTAAALRQAAVSASPVRPSTRRRQEFLRAADDFRQPAPTLPRLDQTPVPFARRRWAVPGLALAALAAVFVCLAAGAAAGGLARMWLGSNSRPVAQASPWSTWVLAATEAGPATAVAVAPADPQSGVLQAAHGLVEVQTADGSWHAAPAGQLVRGGQRVRTHNLSSATVVYYDGSRTELGPNSELSIDVLDAQTSGARVVVLTQWVGESRQVVSPSNDPSSRFQVNTPAGSGTAKGTVFRVRVTPAQQVRFEVGEGAVDVTYLDSSVLVVAGQATVVTAGQPPTAPALVISGEGLVEEAGPTWRIAGRSFAAHGNTLVFGDPRVGDWVTFEGRILADGTHVLDEIILVRRGDQSRFSLLGRVTAIGAGEWSVGGKAVRVDEKTQIDPDLTVGDWVEAVGGISQDGAWWASRITRVAEPGSALTFAFAGVLQAQTPVSWTVSGVTIWLDANAQIDDGVIVGDVIAVEGQVLDDGRWLASHIRRVTSAEAEFSIVGTLESLEPLVVEGIRLVTAEWSDVEPGLAAGDRVQAQGRILDDGTWLAERIWRLDPDEGQAFSFAGQVESIDPWVVANIPVTADGDTVVEPGIAVGDLVRVSGEILPDGTWLARSIQRLDPLLGCLDLRAIVQQIDGNHLVLLDGQAVSLDGVEVEGQLDVATVIIIYACVGPDGQLRIITIIVIYQLGTLPVITPTPAPTVSAPNGEKVTLCHRPPGNPGNAHTITVGASAVPAHLGHGDTLGACGGP